MLSYEHRGLSAGSTRHYRVAAINSGGRGSYSDPASATTLPAAPTGLVAMVVSDAEVALTWQPPTNPGGAAITGYQLWYSEDKDGPWIDLGTTSDGSILSYSHIGLDRGTAYYYRVAAINSGGRGSYTDPPVSATTYDVPSVPMGLAAVTVSRDRIDVEWEAPDSDGGTPITGYQLQVSEDGGTTFSNLYRTNGTILSYEHRGLSAGSTRHYRVAAINSGGRGSYSDPASATTLPAAPTGLVAMVVSDAGVALTWQPPTNPGGAAITGYQLWYSEDKDGPWIDLGTTSDGSILSYSHIGLDRGTAYYYRVAAINSGGRGSYSEPASATTLPAAPTGLVAMVVSDAEVALTWQPPGNDGGVAITGYQLQVSEDGGTTFSNLYRTNGTILSYEHRGLSAGSTRHYRVAAINSGGRGPYTALVSVKTFDVPAAPTDLVAMAVGETQINLSWLPPSDDGGVPITGYQIGCSTNGGTTYNDLEIVSDVSYQHRGLSPGTTYHYRVVAINGIGMSDYSLPVAFRSESVSLCPNPTSDELHIKLPTEGVYAVRLCTLAGQLLLHRQVQGSCMLFLSGFQEGVYVVDIQGQDGYRSAYRLLLTR